MLDGGKMKEIKSVDDSFDEDEIKYMKKHNIKRYYIKLGKNESEGEIEFFDKPRKR